MQQVLGEVLPLALGIAISPIPVIAIILMLITPKARSNGLAFLVGWMAGLLIVGGLALVVANVAGASASSGSSSQASAVIRLVLGLLLLVLARTTVALASEAWRRSGPAAVDEVAGHVHVGQIPRIGGIACECQP